MQSLQLPHPYAIMLVGIPGSGKTFFAAHFADAFRIPYIDSLVIESHSRDDTAASQMIGFVLGEIAKTGKSFVFEGDSDSRVRRTEFATWARSKGYAPLFVWVQTDSATSLDRTLRAKTMTKEAFAGVLKTFSPPHDSEKPVVISGKHTQATQTKVVLKRLADNNRPQRTTTPHLDTASPTSRSIPIR